MADDVTSLIPTLLREIRDEIRSTRTELREEIHAVRTELSARIDGLADRMDRSERRQTESELRFGTAIADLQLAMNQNTAALRVLMEEMKRQGDLIVKQGERIDNVLLGVPGETMRDIQRRLRVLEQRAGIAG